MTNPPHNRRGKGGEEMKFTPAPWKVVHEFNIEQAETRRGICSCGGYSNNRKVEETVKENIANAHLVAAAPEMYEALSRIKILLDEKWSGYYGTVYPLIEAALSKAEGRDGREGE